jgi:hypothetical protein
MTRTSPWLRAFINAFIVLQLYVIVFWGMPGWNLRQALIQPVEPYVLKLGLWHSWDMFSPDPLAVNFHLEAHITYADGSVRIWEFPRMEKLGYWERYQKERFRKWRERVRQDVYAVVWDDTARYVARLNNNNPANPPRQVVLMRHWGPIPPPEPVARGKRKLRDYQPIAEEYPMPFNFRFHFYDVQPEDLRSHASLPPRNEARQTGGAAGAPGE